MRELLSVLGKVYTRWRFVEDRDPAKPAAAPSGAPGDEVTRLHLAIKRERQNLDYFRRFNCGTLAGSCVSSIRAMESRIRAVDLRTRKAV